MRCLVREKNWNICLHSSFVRNFVLTDTRFAFNLWISLSIRAEKPVSEQTNPIYSKDIQIRKAKERSCEKTHPSVYFDMGEKGEWEKKLLSTRSEDAQH